jgi:hypothetical protein
VRADVIDVFERHFSAGETVRPHQLIERYAPAANVS